MSGADRLNRESGTAIVEFVFIAVVILVPLMYLLVAVATVQRAKQAVGVAAREIGRAFATSDSAEQASLRVAAALRLALQSSGSVDQVQTRYVAVGASCEASPVNPQLRAGGEFTVCVRSQVDLPAVPSVVAGKGITVVGRYTVHVDEFRALP